MTSSELRITVYGCGPDEAAVFREVAPRFGVVPAITGAAVSDANIELACGNRCISVGHKAPVTNSTLLALSRAGVGYVSTRSIGSNHIDVNYAQRVGIRVGTVAYSPHSVAYDTRPTAAARYVPLGELLERSDIVTLHTPLTADTHHLLDHRRIGQLKHGAFIVNTGRGSLLDTESLLSALESGRLGGAALDVLEGEDGIFYADCRNTPIENTLLPRLQRLPNVIISPHTAYYTDHALSDTVENTIINCLAFEKENVAWTS